MNIVGARLEELSTPALLLDPAKMDRNIARMRAKVAELGIAFRPHIKTSKAIEVVRRLVDADTGPITVSTLREADEMAELGFTDILYAVGITPNKFNRVVALKERGVDIKLITDSAEAALLLSEKLPAFDPPIPVLIEIDADRHRAGVAPDDHQLLLAIAEVLRGGVRLGGVMAHAGGSYGARSPEELRAYAEQERAAVVAAAETLRAAGHAVEIVSVGSTPSVLFSEDMTGVTEARAGVFVFFDLVMAGLGVCALEDIAVSVLATVNGVQADRGRAIIDAGWSAMSRDRGTASQPIDQGYGVICDRSGRAFPDLLMIEANQEHGVVAARPGWSGPRTELHIGDMVRVLPNHVCSTAGQHDAYLVLGEDGETVVARWRRFGGW